MNLSRLHVLVFLALPAACLPIPVAAQDGKKDQVEAKGAVSEKVSPLLAALRKAKAEDRPRALIAFINDKVSTNSLYSGQYDELKQVEGVGKLVRSWIKTPPGSVLDTVPFRQACIRALRDIHGKTAPAEVVKDLESLVTNQTEEGSIRQEAVYAMAQFGNRTFVDRLIQAATVATKGASAQQQAQGYSSLANVYYQIRDYEKGVAAYKGLLALHEAGKIDLGQQAPTTYYNCACSMSLAGKTDEAFTQLEKAMKGRTLPRRMLQEDMDIAALRKDPRFAKLMETTFGLKKRAAGDGKAGKDRDR